MANSGNGLLEELLVVDVLKGIGQDPDLVKRLKAKINPKAAEFLERVETEFFGRSEPLLDLDPNGVGTCSRWQLKSSR